MVVVDDGGQASVLAASGQGDVPDLQQAGDPLGGGALSFFPFESGEEERLVGVVALSDGGAGEPGFDIVGGLDDGELEQEQLPLPLGSDPRWAHVVGEELAMTLRMPDGSGVLILSTPTEEEPITVDLGEWADADGEPEVDSVALVDGRIFIVLQRTEGAGGPPSVEGPVVLRLDGDDVSELGSPGPSDLIAPTFASDVAALVVGDDTDWAVHALDVDGSDAAADLRFGSDGLPSGTPGFVADDDGRVLLLLADDDRVDVRCSAPGEELVETAEVAGELRHAHLSRSGVLSLALGDGGGGRLWMGVLDGCALGAAARELELDLPPIGVGLSHDNPQAWP